MSQKTLLIFTLILFTLLIIAGALFWLNQQGYIKILGESLVKPGQLNQEFALKIGESVYLASEKLQLKLAKIEDSRCPVELFCVWPGTVKATVELVKNQENLGELVLFSRSDWEGKLFDLYKIKVGEISPRNLSQKNPANLADYTISFTIIPSGLTENPSLKKLQFIFDLEGRKADKSTSAKMEILHPITLNSLRDFNLSIQREGKGDYDLLTVLDKVKLTVKPVNYLSRTKELTLASPLEITFSQFLAGDFNDDNMINSLDFSLLNKVWGKFDTKIDLNQDGTINSLDFSFLNKNWGKQGETTKTTL